jgi:heterotetrameric sarcosine oxidase gamma subunit
MTNKANAYMVERMHPLAALAAALSESAEVRLAALPTGARWIIRGDTMDVGLAKPEVCRATVNGDHALLWLGPDEYLLLAPEGVNGGPMATDVSHRDTAIEVFGPRAALVINAFCALDLHASAFPVGMCTRTIFAKAQIILWRTDAETFRIEVARSFASYVWGCLEEARREFLA